MKPKKKLSPEVAALGRAVLDLRSRIAKLEKALATRQSGRTIGFHMDGPDTVQGEVVPQMEDD